MAQTDITFEEARDYFVEYMIDAFRNASAAPDLTLDKALILSIKEVGACKTFIELSALREKAAAEVSAPEGDTALPKREVREERSVLLTSLVGDIDGVLNGPSAGSVPRVLENFTADKVARHRMHIIARRSATGAQPA